MGYAIPSIVFSTLFLFASYGFLYLFLTHTSIKQKRSYSYKWIRMALWFMAISSLGPWVLGFIMNTVGGESPWYRNAIYFYLHFQYNGWFVVALIGMLFFYLEKSGIPLNKFLSKIIFWTFNSGVILTFFLSILWMKPHGFYYLISGLGGILQLISFLLIVKILISQRTMISRLFSKKEGSFLKLAGVLFLVKLIIQFLGAYPEIATLVSSNKDMIIGYLHWVFLGIVSISIFAFAVKSELMKMSWMAYYFYLIGFFITEFLLFYKGIMAWQTGTIYEDIQLHLFIGSLIVSLSAAYIFLKQLTQKQN
jgi:hypothetical protein